MKRISTFFIRIILLATAMLAGLSWFSARTANLSSQVSYRKRRSMQALAVSLLAFLLVAFGVAHRAEATHFRGLEASATIDAAGVVTLEVKTRWRKGPASPIGGIDPSRFGTTISSCPVGATTTVIFQVQRVGVGVVAGFDPIEGFTLAESTTATDTSKPNFDERTQVITIDLSNEPNGQYDVIWTDFSRVGGIQNMPPSQDNAFGFRIRITKDGTANSTPQFGAEIQATVERGQEYRHSLNISDPDGDSFFVSLPPTGSETLCEPHYSVLLQIPGLTLNQLTGEIVIPSADTLALADNAVGEPGADYRVMVEAVDTLGNIAVNDFMLDAIPPSTLVPALTPWALVGLVGALLLAGLRWPVARG